MLHLKIFLIRWVLLLLPMQAQVTQAVNSHSLVVKLWYLSFCRSFAIFVLNNTSTDFFPIVWQNIKFQDTRIGIRTKSNTSMRPCDLQEANKTFNNNHGSRLWFPNNSAQGCAGFCSAFDGDHVGWEQGKQMSLYLSVLRGMMDGLGRLYVKMETKIISW